MTTINTKVLSKDEWAALDASMKKFVDEMVQEEAHAFIIGYLSSMLVNTLGGADTHEQMIARIERGYTNRYK